MNTDPLYILLRVAKLNIQNCMNIPLLSELFERSLHSYLYKYELAVDWILSPFITLLGLPNQKSWFIWISLFCQNSLRGVCWFIRLGIWLWVDEYWSPMDPYWSKLKIKMLCISQFCMNSLKGFCIFTILYILVRVAHYCWWIWTFALAMACDIFDKERISTKSEKCIL